MQKPSPDHAVKLRTTLVVVSLALAFLLGFISGITLGGTLVYNLIQSDSPPAPSGETPSALQLLLKPSAQPTQAPLPTQTIPPFETSIPQPTLDPRNNCAGTIDCERGTDPLCLPNGNWTCIVGNPNIFSEE